MGGKRLNAPVQSLVPVPTGGGGYWLVASDGVCFAFGDAPFRGSMGGVKLAKPVTGMVPYGNGYLMVGEDGGIFSFSDQPFAGVTRRQPAGPPDRLGRGALTPAPSRRRTAGDQPQPLPWNSCSTEQCGRCALAALEHQPRAWLFVPR